jgi:hypothetical protein
LAYVVAALVAYFTPYQLEAGVLLAVVLAFLKLFQINPQIKQRSFQQMLNKTTGHGYKPE